VSIVIEPNARSDVAASFRRRPSSCRVIPGRGRQCFDHSEISREVGRQSSLSMISTERSGKVSSGAHADNVCDFNSRSPPPARTNTHKARVKISTHSMFVLAPAGAVTAGVCARRNGFSSQLRRTNSQALMSAVSRLRRVSARQACPHGPRKRLYCCGVAHWRCGP
jgi:hypothetical protein